MKIGIIISQTGSETIWNALRFSNSVVLEGYGIKIFLLGAGVEIESIKSEKFHVQEQLGKLKELGRTMLACGTCFKSRDMQFEVCPISTMKDMLRIVRVG